MNPSENKSESDHEAVDAKAIHTAQKTAKEDKLPIHEKTLYGMGSPALGLTTNIVDAQIQQVLVYGLGMSPAMKSIILMIFRIWDALIDPVMGWVSDNTRSRWGRRRPYMCVGCIAMAILTPFIWRFSAEWDMTWIAVWFTIGGILVSTATTLYNIPYQTLKMEMTPDYNERTSLNVYCSFIGKAFAMVTPWFWAMTQLPFFTGQAEGEEPNSLLGIQNVSLWVAVVMLVIGLVPVFISKERYYTKASQQKKEPFWKSLKMTASSVPFRMMLLFILLLSMEGLVMGMGGYLTTYYVMGGDVAKAAVYFGIGGTSSMILAIGCLPLFGWMAMKYGKERSLFFIVVAQVAMAISILFFFNPEYPWMVVIPAALNGPIITGMWVMVPSMKADIVDHDELKTGERREGSFESAFSWFQKFSGTLFLGFSGFIVVFLGFDIELKENQAEGVFRNMILAMAVVPFIFSIVEAWIIYKWPLTAGVMEDIRAQLEERRGKINS